MFGSNGNHGVFLSQCFLELLSVRITYDGDKSKFDPQSLKLFLYSLLR